MIIVWFSVYLYNVYTLFNSLSALFIHPKTYRQIVRTDEFRGLSEERIKELLSQDGLSVKSEVDILTALVVWLNSNLSLTPDVE